MYKILDFIEEKGIEILDFLDVFLPEEKIDYRVKREKRRKLQKYLHKLKNDGLVSENSTGQITLTIDGRERLEFLKTQALVDKDSYKKEANDKVIIISYDIPVKLNRERNVLREILKMLGFNIIHKSVWVGKVKLPKQFIIALEKLDILSYVEILEVTKNGTLKSYN